MDPKSGYISLGKEKLHFLQYGKGAKLLLAFHGYAVDATMFAPIAASLEKEYTVCSVDLPFHGKSQWSNETRVTKSHLVSLVHLMKNKFSVDKMSLIGYSMGGRICLQIIELMPECVDKVALLASDGLTTNFYYYFLTNTGFGRFIFVNSLQKPSRYIQLLGIMRRMKLINVVLFRFIMQNINSAEKRNHVQSVWLSLNEILPDHRKLKQEIIKYQIPITIFMGRNDKIIPASNAYKFKNGLETVNLITTKKGHHLPDSSNLQMIADSLL